MSTRPDPDVVIASWLQDEARDGASDRLLAATRRQLESTHQRPAWWLARRFQEMNMPIRLAVGAAALLAVAVVGINVLPRQGGVGAPGASPTPAPTPSPSLTASPIPLPASGSLQPGTYTIDDRRYTQATHFVVTVPAGWTSDDPFIAKNSDQPGEVGLTTWVVSHVYTDSCQHTTDTLVDVGTSPDKLVSTLMALKSRVVSAPTDATIGGFPAKRLELSVPAGLDVSTCTFGAIKNWPDPGPDESGGLCCGGPGFVDVVYVVDINGKALAVVTRYLPGSSPQDLAELQAIVDSIHIDP